MLRSIVKSLLTFETEAALGAAGYDSSITPANYTFQPAGNDRVDGYECFVVQASPKRKDKYLFEGRIWIEANEFAVGKILVVRQKGLLSGSKAQILPDFTRRSVGLGFL
jgi:hypothetical protein